MSNNVLLGPWEVLMRKHLEAIPAPDHTTYMRLMKKRIEADEQMFLDLKAANPKAKMYLDDLDACRLNRYSDQDYIKLFDSVACTFGRYVHTLSKFKLLGELVPRLEGEQKVLDVGCGLNLYTLFLHKMGLLHGKAFGIDPSPTMIKRAREIAGQEGFKVDLQVGFGQKIPFKEKSFDVVFSFDALHWSMEWEKIVNEMTRVLARNGRLLIAYTLTPEFRSVPDSPKIVRILNKNGVDVDQVTHLLDNEGHPAKIIIGGVQKKTRQSSVFVVNTMTY